MVNKNFLIIIISILLLALLVSLVVQRNMDNKGTIVLGASLPLSGINSNLGKDIVVGAHTYFSHTNARGGINGQKIEFI